jgi:hypothetical protein
MRIILYGILYLAMKYNAHLLKIFDNLSFDSSDIDNHVDLLPELNFSLVFNKIQFHENFISYIREFIEVNPKIVIFEENTQTTPNGEIFFDFFKDKDIFILSSDNRQSGLMSLYPNEKVIECRFEIKNIIDMHEKKKYYHSSRFENSIIKDKELKYYNPIILSDTFKKIYDDICFNYLNNDIITIDDSKKINAFLIFITDLGIFETILKYIHVGDIVIYAEDRHCRAVIKLLNYYLNVCDIK